MERRIVGEIYFSLFCPLVHSPAFQNPIKLKATVLIDRRKKTVKVHVPTLFSCGLLGDRQGDWLRPGPAGLGILRWFCRCCDLQIA